MPMLIAIFSSVGTWCGLVNPNCCISFGRTVFSYFSLSRGAGTGRFAPACGPRTFGSCFRLLFDCFFSGAGLPPGVPPPTAFFSLVSAMGPCSHHEVLFSVSSRARRRILRFAQDDRLSTSRNRLTALHGDPLLRSVIVDPPARPRRLTRLRIEQHHIRRVDGRRKIDDPALLLGATRPT